MQPPRKKVSLTRKKVNTTCSLEEHVRIPACPCLCLDVGLQGRLLISYIFVPAYPHKMLCGALHGAHASAGCIPESCATRTGCRCSGFRARLDQIPQSAG